MSQDPWTEPLVDAPLVSRRTTDPINIVVPGVLLMLVSVLGAGICIFSMYVAEPAPRRAATPANQSGQALGHAIGGVLTGPLPLALNGMMFVGGIAMVRREVWGMAIAGSVVAIFPCTSVLCVSLPIGAWCIYVLNKPGVHQMFAKTTAATKQAGAAECVDEPYSR